MSQIKTVIAIDPCPHCASTKLVTRAVGIVDEVVLFAVCCVECGASGPRSKAKDVAEGMWCMCPRDSSVDEIRDLMEELIATAGSAKAWAKEAGVSETYVSDVRNGKREPGDAILVGLGVRRISVYRDRI